MLLDDKRTKRITQIVAVIATVAFLGAGVVAIGLAAREGCGGGNSAAQQAVEDAESTTRERPQDAQAWLTLASAYRNAERPQDAVTAARRAVRLAPRDINTASSLVLFLRESGQAPAALREAQAFTRRVPDDPEGFLLLAQLSREQGQRTLERLALTRYLQLEPQGALATEARQRVRELSRPAPTQGGTATTTTAP